MSNIYEAPASSLEEEPGTDFTAERFKFYVVGPLKFWLLFIFTLGFYQLYWFYKNWSRYKAYTRDDLWPVPRGIFTIFFTHALLREVDHTIGAEGREHSWSPDLLATGYVLVTIATRIMDRLPDSMDDVVIPLELFLMLPVTGFLLYRAQGAINVACSDPGGSANARLTWANYLWIAAGFILLLLVLLGMLLPEHNAA